MSSINDKQKPMFFKSAVKCLVCFLVETAAVSISCSSAFINKGLKAKGLMAMLVIKEAMLIVKAAIPIIKEAMLIVLVVLLIIKEAMLIVKAAKPIIKALMLIVFVPKLISIAFGLISLMAM